MPRPWGGGWPTPASFNQLDIRWLKRKGLLQSGVRSRITFSSPYPTAPWVREFLIFVDGDEIEIRHEGRTQHLGIVETPVHLGGARPWFRCPSCGGRAAILYGPRFACRKCKHVAYPSQRESPRYRPLQRAQKIRMRLGGDANITLPFPPRPKGMHRVTYWEWQAKAAAHEQRALGALAQRWHSQRDESAI